MAPLREPSAPPTLRAVAGPRPTLASFGRILVHRPRPVDASTTVSPHGVDVAAWRPDADLLQRYRDVVGTTARMPLTFPALIATRLVRDLMGGPGMPVSGLGMVHVATWLWSQSSLPVDAPWQVSTWVDGTRHTRSGMEIDLWSRCRAREATWTMRMVVLARSSAASGDDAPAAPSVAEPGTVDEAAWDVTTTLVADERVGRGYARVSGDANPIHLHALSARPFGFPRAIAHGWWSLPRTLALLGLDDTPTTQPCSLQVAYARPILLPSTPLLHASTAGHQTRFVVVRADGKPHVSGSLVRGTG